MPIIFKCDRCGNIFKPEISSNLFTTHLINSSNKYVIYRSDGNLNFAVCPKCLNELEKWFDNPTNKLDLNSLCTNINAKECSIEAKNIFSSKIEDIDRMNNKESTVKNPDNSSDLNHPIPFNIVLGGYYK